MSEQETAAYGAVPVVPAKAILIVDDDDLEEDVENHVHDLHKRPRRHCSAGGAFLVIALLISIAIAMRRPSSISTVVPADRPAATEANASRPEDALQDRIRRLSFS